MEALRKIKVVLPFFIVILILLLVIVHLVTIIQKKTEDTQHLQNAYDELNNAYNEINVDVLVEQERQKIKDFIQIADEALVYTTKNYYDENDNAYFPELSIGNPAFVSYMRSTMLIDYDSLTVGFCFYDGFWRLQTFPFVPCKSYKQYSENSGRCRLLGFNGELELQYQHMNGDPYMITCFALICYDGSIYTVDLVDAGTGMVYNIGCYPKTSWLEPIKDFQEKKQENATDPTESP